MSARGRRDVKTARVLVNAAGPWIGESRRPLFANRRLGLSG